MFKYVISLFYKTINKDISPKYKKLIELDSGKYIFNYKHDLYSINLSLYLDLILSATTDHLVREIILCLSTKPKAVKDIFLEDISTNYKLHLLLLACNTDNKNKVINRQCAHVLATFLKGYFPKDYFTWYSFCYFAISTNKQSESIDVSVVTKQM